MAPPHLPRVVPALLLAALCIAAVAGFAHFPTYPNYDSQYSLVWGRELLDGVTPTFDAYRAPTEHPLLLAFSVPLAALGDDGSRLLIVLCFVSLVALLIAMYRLGTLAAGQLCGLAAAAIVASRLNLWLLSSIGFLDVPYCALIFWALTLEVAHPRRGGPVWACLALAGLLRPEAWVLAFAYAVWVGWPRDWRGRARTLALAAVAPAIWCAVDLAATGDPLFSIHHTDTLALELSRERPYSELPWLMVRLIAEILKWPVLVAALAGVVVAWRLRVRVLLVPGAVVLIGAATYLVIATGGLAIVYRYLLTVALGLGLFAAYALTGWTTLERTAPWRSRWLAIAALAVALGGVFTLTHTNPRKVRAELRERRHVRDDLRAVLALPAVRAARRCGPITTPNHKLQPDIRWILDLPDGAVRARSDYHNAGRPLPARGVALMIERRYERRPALNVYEVKRDDGLTLQIPPEGFALAGGNRTFAAYVNC